MAKWADYCISAVRYTSQRTHIDVLRVHPDSGESIGAASEMTRTSVINAILQQRSSFITIFENSQGKWNKGASVMVVQLNGANYIKTKNDNTPKDNLENLPEF